MKQKRNNHNKLVCNGKIDQNYFGSEPKSKSYTGVSFLLIVLSVAIIAFAIFFRADILERLQVSSEQSKRTRPPSGHPSYDLFSLFDAKKKPLSTLHQQFVDLHRSSPKDAWILLGLGEVLCALAAEKYSNKLLEECIKTYQDALSLANLTEEFRVYTTIILAERLSFRGWSTEAISHIQRALEYHPKNVFLLNSLGREYLILGNTGQAKLIFERCLKAVPDDPFAQAHLGFIIKTVDNDYPKAIDLLMFGINSDDTNIINDARFYFHLGDALMRVGRLSEADDVNGRAVEKGLFLSKLQRSTYNCAGLIGKTWWTPEQTGHADSLDYVRRHWRAIRDEVVANMDASRRSFVYEDESLRESGDWKQFTLFQRGREVPGACGKAPTTCRVIRELLPDAARCSRGQVKFSMMHGGTHVWPHTGPTNCRLRSHLALIVPEDERHLMSLRVGRGEGSIGRWTEGQWLIFDDSFEHEVWHNGTKPRVVLIVDFWHPDLADDQKRVLSPI